MKREHEIWLLAFASILALLIIFGGCTAKATLELEARHKAIQDCILSGGHAHLGPGNTIWCD